MTLTALRRLFYKIFLYGKRLVLKAIQRTSSKALLIKITALLKNRRCRIALIIGTSSCCLFLLLCNGILIATTAQSIYPIYSLSNENDKQSYQVDRELISTLPQTQAAIVLGARVYKSGTVSPILRDRLTTALLLYRNKRVKKIIVSGDHGAHAYDEVNTMRKWLQRQGVKTRDIFMDHAGFTTYDTMYRARAIFGVKSATVVTQAYHLPRAIFIGTIRGITLYGTPADRRSYVNIRYYRFREFFARTKDFFKAFIFRPKAHFLGKQIPISGDGRLSHD